MDARGRHAFPARGGTLKCGQVAYHQAMPSPLRTLPLVVLLGCSTSSRSTQGTAAEPAPAAVDAGTPPAAEAKGFRIEKLGKKEGFSLEATVVVKLDEDIDGLEFTALSPKAVGFSPREERDYESDAAGLYGRAGLNNTAESEGDGVYTLTANPGTYVLAGRAPGYRPLITEPFTLEPETEYRITGVQLTPGEVLEGSVQLPPETEAEVEVEGQGYRLRTQTEGGGFRFDTLAPGKYTLRTKVKRVGSAEQEVSTGTGPVTVTPNEGQCYTGTVVANGACARCADMHAIQEYQVSVVPEVDPVGPLGGTRAFSRMARDHLYIDVDEEGRFRFCFTAKGPASVLVQSGPMGLIAHDLQPGTHTLELKPLVKVPFRVKGKPRKNLYPNIQLVMPEPWSVNGGLPLGNGRGTVYLFPELSYRFEVPAGTKLLTRMPKNVTVGTWGD